MRCGEIEQGLSAALEELFTGTAGTATGADTFVHDHVVGIPILRLGIDLFSEAAVSSSAFSLGTALSDLRRQISVNLFGAVGLCSTRKR